MKIRELLNILDSTILTESMLMEDRVDFLKNKFTTIIGRMSINVPTEMDLGKYPGANRVEKIFNYLVDSDPSSLKKNAEWILTTFSKGGFHIEDVPQVKEYLEKYLEMKKNKTLDPKYSDIKIFKNLAELKTAVDGKQKQLQHINNTQEEKSTKESEVILNTNSIKIVVPKTEEAACWFGSGTHWCTAYGPWSASKERTNNQFNHYNSMGPLYIIFDKINKRKYQWHFKDSQFQNEKNVAMSHPDFAEFVQEHPEVIKAIGENNFLRYGNKIGLQYFSPEAQEEIKNISDEFALAKYDIRIMSDTRTPPAEDEEFDEYDNEYDTELDENNVSINCLLRILKDYGLSFDGSYALVNDDYSENYQTGARTTLDAIVKKNGEEMSDDDWANLRACVKNRYSIPENIRPDGYDPFDD